MLKPKVDVEEFEKSFGFRKCTGCSGLPIYYLCIARDSKVIFVSPTMIDIQKWEHSDPRIHIVPNCKYRDHRTSIDILYQLIKADMLKGDWEE
nr:MAG TPA: envelope glycoprotein [Caudoviricetes sp.]